MSLAEVDSCILNGSAGEEPWKEPELDRIENETTESGEEDRKEAQTVKTGERMDVETGGGSSGGTKREAR